MSRYQQQLDDSMYDEPIFNPLTGEEIDDTNIAQCLRQIASQENHDGDPYDQMMYASNYIDECHGFIEELTVSYQVLEKRCATYKGIIDAISIYSTSETMRDYEIINKINGIIRRNFKDE